MEALVSRDHSGIRLQGVEEALREGCKMCAFRSGGGLRVVRLEKDTVLKGYGEHPHIEEALAYASEDFLAGGRPYDDVYGKEKAHYLTGDTAASSGLDAWVLQGHTFDAWWSSGQIVFQLSGLMHLETPRNIHDEVMKTGHDRTWQHRGFTFRTHKTALPNGSPCTSTQLVEGSGKGSPWLYRITKTGGGNTLAEAIESAFAAGELEQDSAA
jgi:hypothetical protein